MAFTTTKTFRLDEDLAEQIARAARTERRSEGDMIRLLIETGLAARSAQRVRLSQLKPGSRVVVEDESFGVDANFVVEVEETPDGLAICSVTSHMRGRDTANVEPVWTYLADLETDDGTLHGLRRAREISKNRRVIDPS